MMSGACKRTWWITGPSRIQYHCAPGVQPIPNQVAVCGTVPPGSPQTFCPSQHFGMVPGAAGRGCHWV